jgi:PAS domain S-box-containing protein
LNLFPVRVRDGGTVGLGVIGQDVTEREQAAAVLRENEERFRTLADSMPVLIWLSDEHMKRTYFNRTWLKFVGRSMEQELGDGWIENIHPDHRERYLRAYRKAFEALEPFEIEYQLRRQDGVYRWVLARGEPRFAPTGGFLGFLGVCLDITDRKAAQDEIRDSAERFRTLTEAIPQLVWNANAAGRVTYFNTKWRDYTGLTAGAALDDWWQQIVHPDDVATIQHLWQDALAAPPAPFAHEARIRRHADSEYRWFKLAVVPLRRGDGTLDQWVGSLTDIEEQKQQAVVLESKVQQRTAELLRITDALRDEIEDRVDAETQVRAVARELERSNGELEKFAYVASHDLQEPLRKIQAFGDRLRERCREQVSDQGRDYIDRMLASAGRMRRLIDDLLAFSRVTTHARPFETVDLNTTLHGAADDLAALIERTGGTLDLGSLPTLEADPSQIRQLFQNLIANALKFHRPGTPPVVTVRSELLAEPGRTPQYRLTVSDNGIGFEEKYLSRIFEVFQRLHGREDYEGTGVGLAICKKIVERHNGTITATSAPDNGSTFVITLPARQTEPVASP